MMRIENPQWSQKTSHLSVRSAGTLQSEGGMKETDRFSEPGYFPRNEFERPLRFAHKMREEYWLEQVRFLSSEDPLLRLNDYAVSDTVPETRPASFRRCGSWSPAELRTSGAGPVKGGHFTGQESQGEAMGIGKYLA